MKAVFVNLTIDGGDRVQEITVNRTTTAQPLTIQVTVISALVLLVKIIVMAPVTVGVVITLEAKVVEDARSSVGFGTHVDGTLMLLLTILNCDMNV